ncbi:MAG: alpha-E domain-containing protein [Anaerolineae bacterium]|uniref:alpha-E domain-containing protein n=1 Tax=Candidatus Flexifilum breve TaxID=3140694 RepID=UPI001AC3051B|nr:alpha-E domain-containing protein [Chloroflexota bacterium]MBK9751405.1 alpha-E domain-containing protein [Chloroflexota bacterium]MBN8634213.1 alpha-E domain-containing protein [Anaerolineae bacterium]
MLSRVADSLYWMSRYLERAEHNARVLDLQLHLMLELAPEMAERSWMRLLDSLVVEPPSGPCDPYSLTHLLTFDARNANSIVACVSSARENARHVREQISSEMWEHVNRLSLQARTVTLDAIWNDQPHEFLRSVKEGCHLFQGITDSTMTHGEGWQFIQIGRAVERAAATAQLLKSHYAAYPHIDSHARVSEDFVEWIGLLKSCTAFEAYCKVYTADLRPDRIAEFLVLNPDFPHSIRFAVNSLSAALQAVTQMTESKRAKSVNRLGGRLRAALDYGQIDEIMVSGLHKYLDAVLVQAEAIHDAIYEAYIWYPIDELVM